MKRKRPTGEDFANWCMRWDTLDHEGKKQLAQEHGVSYGTAKHWRSDNEIAIVEKPPINRIDVDELLQMRPAVNLDFVTFDIESSGLEADFSIMLSAVIKPFGLPPIVFRADNYPEWSHDRANDKSIIVDVTTELRKHAVVIAHYGSKFDVPFIRAKMVKHGLEPLPQMFGIDTWRIAKNNFAVSSRRQKSLATFFDIGDKEPVDGPLWMSASYNADGDALDKIVEHNIRDCEILEKLACISFPLLKSIPKL